MTTAEMGARIAELRKMCGMSQQELSDSSCVSRWMISQFEKGKQNISTENLIKLSNALQAEIVIQVKDGQ